LAAAGSAHAERIPPVQLGNLDKKSIKLLHDYIEMLYLCGKQTSLNLHMTPTFIESLQRMVKVKKLMDEIEFSNLCKSNNKNDILHAIEMIKAVANVQSDKNIVEAIRSCPGIPPFSTNPTWAFYLPMQIEKNVAGFKDWKTASRIKWKVMKKSTN
jgi:hypothetical protein